MSNTSVDRINNGFAKKYTYPKANATNGGETQSEYNIRSSLMNILSYSGAISNDEFDPSDGPIVCNYNDTVTPSGASLPGQMELVLGRGRGNCNAYFVNVGNFGITGNPEIIPFNVENYLTTEFPNTYDPMDSTTKYRFGLYLSVLYSNTIADDIAYRFICDGVKGENDAKFIKTDTPYARIYANEYEGQYFKDIGILVGYMTYNPNWENTGKGVFDDFTKNPDITKCIDIYRLGSEDGIVETLANLIKRLRELNVFGGNLYVSDTLNQVGDDLHSDGVIDAYGGDYRLRIHENIDTYDDGSQTNKKYIHGGLDLVNTNIGGEDQVVQDLFTFETNAFDIPVDTFDDTPTTESDLIPDNGQITLSNVPIIPGTVTLDGGTTYDDGNGHIGNDLTIDYATGIISGFSDSNPVTVSYKYIKMYIKSIVFNPDVVVTNFDAEYANINHIDSNLAEIDRVISEIISIKNSSNYCNITMDSAHHVYFSDESNNDTISIHANKVYGAVWM